MFCCVYKTSAHCCLLRLAFRNANPASRRTYKSHKVKLDEYLTDINAMYLKNFLPPKLLKFAKSTRELYLIDDNVAEHLSQTIVQNFYDNKLVVETNPGLGILTKRLLDNGVQRINLYESNAHFYPHLYNLMDAHKENITLNEKSLLESMKFNFQDRMDAGSREKDIVKTFPRRRWAQDPPVTIVATLTSTSFIRYLMLSLFLQNGLMIHCRPDLFLIVSQKVYNALMTSNVKYHRQISFMFNMTFRVKVLTKVPRASFLPWVHKSKKSLVKGEDPNLQEMYLVQATGRPDFYEAVVPPERMRELWYFISMCFIKDKMFVIPTLEKYIPNCGPRVIFGRGDYNIYTRFNDLTVEEILSLFRQFTSWPEYSVSVFNDCVQTLFMKSNVTLEEMERHLNQQSAEDGGKEEEEEEESDSDKEDSVEDSITVNN